MKTLTGLSKKETAIKLIKQHIEEIREFHDSTTVDRYDGAVAMAYVTGLISKEQRKEFDDEVDNILYI